MKGEETQRATKSAEMYGHICIHTCWGEEDTASVGLLDASTLGVDEAGVECTDDVDDVFEVPCTNRSSLSVAFFITNMSRLIFFFLFVV